MIERTVTHRQLFNKATVTYYAYLVDEAEKLGIKYKYWKNILPDDKHEVPFYVSTDDKFVIPIYDVAIFKQFYRLRSAFGCFVYPLNAKIMKETKLYVFLKKKPSSDEAFTSLKEIRHPARKRIIATMLANGLTPEEVVFTLAGNENYGLAKSIKAFMKTEECIKMASELVKKALVGKGITEERVVEWLMEVYTMAKEDRKPQFMMDVINNVQDLLVMKDNKLTVMRSVEIEQSTEDLKRLENVKERAKLTETTQEY